MEWLIALLLLACPISMFFMHRSHGSHGRHDAHGTDSERPEGANVGVSQDHASRERVAQLGSSPELAPRPASMARSRINAQE